MLNLPSGAYPVLVNGDIEQLELAQEQFAVPMGGGAYRLMPLNHVPKDGTGSAQALRTLVKLRETRNADSDQLPAVPEEALVDEIARQQIFLGNPLAGQELTDAARAELNGFDDESRGSLSGFVSRKLHCRDLFSPEKISRFIAATNTLVRRYMVDFGDPFAEEIVLHHLASTWTSGVLQVLQCDDALLDSVHFAGKIPPIMRRPWVNHPAERVDNLRVALASGAPVDPIELLAARANAFLERGATRSAVIEASAALESAVARRLRNALIKSGLSEGEAIDRLRSTPRFPDRCKSLMREFAGVSLADVEPSLWEQVTKHRDNYRHKVTHDDSEPSLDAAREAVQDFMALARIAQHCGKP